MTFFLGYQGIEGWTSRVLRGNDAILETFSPLNQVKRISIQCSSGKSFRQLAVRIAHMSKATTNEIE